MADSIDDLFCEFVRARSPALLRTAFLLTGDRHLAEDLVQDALARTHRGRRRLTDPGHFEAYTRTAMYHQHVSWWARRKVAESLPGELADVVQPGSDHARRTDLKLALHQALAQLTQRQRAVLVARFFEDRSEAETANLLAMLGGHDQESDQQGAGPHAGDSARAALGSDGGGLMTDNLGPLRQAMSDLSEHGGTADMYERALRSRGSHNGGQRSPPAPRPRRWCSPSAVRSPSPPPPARPSDATRIHPHQRRTPKSHLSVDADPRDPGRAADGVAFASRGMECVNLAVATAASRRRRRHLPVPLHGRHGLAIPGSGHRMGLQGPRPDRAGVVLYVLTACLGNPAH